MSRKVVLALLVCVVSAIAIGGGYPYLRTNNLESRIDSLERTNEESAWQLSQLSNLSSSSIEIVGPPTWGLGSYDYATSNFYSREVNLTVKNNGTSILSIVGVLVNDTFINLSTRGRAFVLSFDDFDDTYVPILLFPGAQITLNLTHPNGSFILGAKYQFSVVALIGASSPNSPYEATFPVPQLKIKNMSFENTAEGKYVNVTLTNIGTSSITINEIWINNEVKWIISKTMAIGEQGTIGIQYDWSNGAQYEVEVVTSKGDEYTYASTAPS